MLQVPIGFVSDHLEVLYDIDIEAKEKARALGMTLHRTELPNAKPEFFESWREWCGGRESGRGTVGQSDREPVGSRAENQRAIVSNGRARPRCLLSSVPRRFLSSEPPLFLPALFLPAQLMSARFLPALFLSARFLLPLFLPAPLLSVSHPLRFCQAPSGLPVPKSPDMPGGIPPCLSAAQAVTKRTAISCTNAERGVLDVRTCSFLVSHAGSGRRGMWGISPAGGEVRVGQRGWRACRGLHCGRGHDARGGPRRAGCRARHPRVPVAAGRVSPRKASRSAVPALSRRRARPHNAREHCLQRMPCAGSGHRSGSHARPVRRVPPLGNAVAELHHLPRAEHRGRDDPYADVEAVRLAGAPAASAELRPPVAHQPAVRGVPHESTGHGPHAPLRVLPRASRGPGRLSQLPPNAAGRRAYDRHPRLAHGVRGIRLPPESAGEGGHAVAQ